MAIGKQVGFRLSAQNLARFRQAQRLYGFKTFDEWLSRILVTDRVYRTERQYLHHEIAQLRKLHLPFDACDAEETRQAPALRPSEDDRYDYLLQTRP